MDFGKALVDFSLQPVSDESASESIGSSGYGKFSSYDSCDFSSLPTFRVMQ